MERRSTYEELELRIKELEIKLRDLKEAEKKLRETQNIKQLLKFIGLSPKGPQNWLLQGGTEASAVPGDRYDRQVESG